jgi:serine/threonine protein kinase
VEPLRPVGCTPCVLHLGEVRFELLDRLGGGACGAVHVARAVGGWPGERIVCIKRLIGHIDPPQADALREEARVLARVRHANVVSLLAFGEDPVGGPFLVLDWVDGLDLRALTGRLPRGDRLPDMVAVHVACGLLRALANVQRALPGLVHRDVSPHNVLVSRDGEVKLADFGICLARGRTRWTRPLFVKGKLGYMSPEQILGQELDPRSDLFAVGIVLYELLCGVRPWGALRGIREMRAVVEHQPVPLAARRSGVHRALAAAVDRLLAHRRQDRFATAEDALRALAPFGAGELGSLRLGAIVAPLVSARAAMSMHDISCHADDLTARNEFPNGNAQKKGK